MHLKLLKLVLIKILVKYLTVIVKIISKYFSRDGTRRNMHITDYLELVITSSMVNLHFQHELVKTVLLPWATVVIVLYHLFLERIDSLFSHYVLKQ